jgi:D-amino-acid oxidase
MQLDRRAFVASSAAALTLSGCATVPRRDMAGCSPLPPVDVSADRVIRVAAGLRPYRSSGFVVRRETLGDKALVHNYGHGGAGITLSWGSSRLAVDLGVAGHAGPVAVIGSGIMGLTTARLVQEAGFPVTIYAKALGPDTTSFVAGGQISPFGHFSDDEVTPEWRQQFLSAMAYSWRRFSLMVGEEYGVRWLPTYEQGSDPGPPDLEPYSPNSQSLTAAQHPFPVEPMVRFDTMYVETGRFLAQLTADVLAAGGKIRLREFHSPADLSALDEQLVLNCTGIGARALFGDEGMIPVRGQLAILRPQPEVRYAASGQWGYMFPRADGIILGGTFERNVWDTTPDPARIERILASHKAIFDNFRCRA